MNPILSQAALFYAKFSGNHWVITKPGNNEDNSTPSHRCTPSISNLSIHELQSLPSQLARAPKLCIIVALQILLAIMNTILRHQTALSCSNFSSNMSN